MAYIIILEQNEPPGLYGGRRTVLGKTNAQPIEWEQGHMDDEYMPSTAEKWWKKSQVVKFCTGTMILLQIPEL